MVWFVIMAVVVIAALALGGLLLALMRSAASDSASVNEEYEELLRSRDEKAADEEAKEGHGSPDESHA